MSHSALMVSQRQMKLLRISQVQYFKREVSAHRTHSNTLVQNETLLMWIISLHNVWKQTVFQTVIECPSLHTLVNERWGREKACPWTQHGVSAVVCEVLREKWARVGTQLARSDLALKQKKKFWTRQSSHPLLQISSSAQSLALAFETQRTVVLEGVWFASTELAQPTLPLSYDFCF